MTYQVYHTWADVSLFLNGISALQFVIHRFFFFFSFSKPAIHCQALWYRVLCSAETMWMKVLRHASLLKQTWQSSAASYIITYVTYMQSLLGSRLFSGTALLHCTYSFRIPQSPYKRRSKASCSIYLWLPVWPNRVWHRVTLHSCICTWVQISSCANLAILSGMFIQNCHLYVSRNP